MKPDLPIKDSGDRRQYDTGAQRDRAQGKGRYDLISPIFLERLALHLEKGASKYNDRNWEKGMPLNDYIDSALRHICQYLGGLRDEDHLAAVAFNIMGLIHTEEMIERSRLPSSLNNMPDYTNLKYKKEKTVFDNAGVKKWQE